MIMRLLYLCLIAAVTLMTMGKAQADRLKDMTSIAGVRSNQLVGYGLVVGFKYCIIKPSGRCAD